MDGRNWGWVPFQLSFHQVLLTHKDNLYPQLIGGKQRTFDHRTWGTVASHRINGNPHHG
jgi:hypothetical protein